MSVTVSTPAVWRRYSAVSTPLSIPPPSVPVAGVIVLPRSELSVHRVVCPMRKQSVVVPPTGTTLLSTLKSRM